MSNTKFFVSVAAMFGLYFMFMKVFVGPEVATKRAMAEENARLGEADADVENSGRDIRSAITLCLENHGLQVLGSRFNTRARTNDLETAYFKTKPMKGGKIRSQLDLDTALSRSCDSHGYEVVDYVPTFDDGKITEIFLRLRPAEDE